MAIDVRRHQRRIRRLETPRLDRMRVGQLVAQAAEISNSIDRRWSHRGAGRAVGYHPAQDLRRGLTYVGAKLRDGKDDPQGEVRVFPFGWPGERVKYYEVELENVIVAHVAQGVSGGDIMSENIGLKFSKVRWRYTQQKITGGSGGNTAGGWDLATNRIAV